MSFAENALPLFLLILVRVASIFMFAPIFSSRRIPAIAKVSMAIFISIFIHGTLRGSVSLPDSSIAYLYCVLTEIVVGYALAGLLQLIFNAVEMAASLSGLLMGFGFGGVLDPDSGQSSDFLVQIYSLWAGLLFLMLNGHHRLLEAMLRSFEWIEPGQAVLTVEFAGRLLTAFTALFPFFLRLAAPLLLALFIAGIGMAVVSRFLPTLNIFLMDFPIKVMVGLLLMSLTLPYFGSTFADLIAGMWNDLKPLVQSLHV